MAAYTKVAGEETVREILSIIKSVKDSIPDIAELINPNLVPIEYQVLKQLYDNQNLVPGTLYRIIDYQVVPSKTSGWQADPASIYDVIVLALSDSILSHDAWATVHVGNEDYYKYCNLNKWRLKYDIENDAQKYSWAQSNGKGVVYWLKDDYDNEAWFDFKQIKLTIMVKPSAVSCGTDEIKNWFAGSLTGGVFKSIEHRHIFTDYDSNDDRSVPKQTASPTSDLCTGNVIESNWTISTFDGNNPVHKTLSLPNYVYIFKGSRNNIIKSNCQIVMIDGHDNVIEESCSGVVCQGNGNRIGRNCQNIYLDCCEKNTIASDCNKVNMFGSYNLVSASCAIINIYCDFNRVGDGCDTVTIWEGGANNSVKTYCSVVTILKNGSNNVVNKESENITIDGDNNATGDDSYNITITGMNNNIGISNGDVTIIGSHNTTGSTCRHITLSGISNSLGNDCANITTQTRSNSNSLGNTCKEIHLGTDCCNNSFGNMCIACAFGNNSSANTLGNECVLISGGEYVISNVFESSCLAIPVGNHIYACHFGNGCQFLFFGNIWDGNRYTLLDYVQNIIVEPFVSNIRLFPCAKQYCPAGGNSDEWLVDGQLKNITICHGTNNAPNANSINDIYEIPKADDYTRNLPEEAYGKYIQIEFPMIANANKQKNCYIDKAYTCIDQECFWLGGNDNANYNEYPRNQRNCRFIARKGDGDLGSFWPFG